MSYDEWSRLRELIDLYRERWITRRLFMDLWGVG